MSKEENHDFQYRSRTRRNQSNYDPEFEKLLAIIEKKDETSVSDKNGDYTSYSVPSRREDRKKEEGLDEVSSKTKFSSHVSKDIAEKGSCNGEDPKAVEKKAVNQSGITRDELEQLFQTSYEPIREKSSNHKSSKKKRRLKSWVYNLIFLSFFLVLIFCGFLIYHWMRDNASTKQLEKQLQEEIEVKEVEDGIHVETVNPPDASAIDDYWEYIKTPFIEVNFDKLLKKNKDTVAWIQVPGTNVNYPVVQTSNNRYYLTHAMNGKQNNAGWIFGDYRNDFTNLDHNTIIYGHSRWNNTMFGSLRNIMTTDWQKNKENHIVKLSTPTENMIFQVFSVYEIVAESYYITNTFSDTESFSTFLNTLKDRSVYDFSASVNENDKILTLSTCRADDEWRIVLHAKLIKREKK